MFSLIISAIGAITGLGSYVKLGILGGGALVAFFIYGWGATVISNYGGNYAKIAQLERTNALILSRVTSYQIITERYKASIEAASPSCKAQVMNFYKNPDLLKKHDPFTPSGGG